ncbi:MAG: hypothetical protein LBD93_12040 [Treponema sp.]|nr:hypothetical protein [Treponema sp.]
MAAVERSEGKGILSSWDGENLRCLTLGLQQEIYSPYTEFAEVSALWEHSKLIDYEGIIRVVEAAATRKAQAVARKLSAMGISEEQIAAAGLLEIAEQ